MVSVVAMAVAVPMAMGEGASTGAAVNNVPPVVSAAAVTDPGSMNLHPATTTVTVTATVTDNNGIDDVTSVMAEINGSISGPVAMTKGTATDTSAVYSVDIAVAACTTPGVDAYLVTVTAKDTALATHSDTDLLTIPESTGLTLDFDAVSFAADDPGATNIAGTAKSGVSPVTGPGVTNRGNTAKNIGVIANTLTGATHTTETIAGSNMEASIGGLAMQAVGSKVTFVTNTGCGVESSAAFQLDLPMAMLPDTYAGTLTISVE